MDNKTMLGLKLYKDNEDDGFDVVRIVRIYSDPSLVKIKDKDGKEEKLSLEEIASRGYTILDSKGVIMFSIVTVGKNKDVVVSLVKKMDMAMGNAVPCVICRQSVTDFFYNIISNSEEHEYVGISCSDKTCPTNIEFGELLMCDSIEFSEVVNVYLDDTIDTVCECVRVSKYDEVLSNLYKAHSKAIKNASILFKDSDAGWCKTLKKLLSINNFWIDIDAAFNITDVNFDINENCVVKKDNKDQEYTSLNNGAAQFLSSIWFSVSDTKRMNISDSIVTTYDYDIDFGEYRNENYVLVRDKTNTLFLIVYTVDGEYFEGDLEAERNKLSSIFGLTINNKYSKKR